MYGTDDSNLWQTDDAALLESRGFAAGRSNPTVLFCEKVVARLLVHGDDLVLLGDAAPVADLHELLNTRCTVKLVAQIGKGKQEQEAVMLNRVAGCQGMQMGGWQWNWNQIRG